MKKHYLLYARSVIPFLTLLLLFISSSLVIGQTLDRPATGFLTDDVKPNYNGWIGHPDTIQVYGAPPVNQDSLKEACKRWNDAGGNPKLQVTTKKEDAEVTVAIDPGLSPGTGLCSYEYYPSGYSSATITINPGAPPECGETELITHELGHALGLADTDSAKNSGDSMKGNGSNGKGGKLSKHDSAEIKAAADLNVTQVPADAPPVAIAPGMYAIANFPLSQAYPPEIAAVAVISVVPLRDPDIIILGAMVTGDHLSVDIQVLPDHWSGQFFLDINIEFPPPYDPVAFRGWHYINNTPVPPTVFDCPFVVTPLPDHTTMIEWESTCTYPFPGAELRSILTINDYVAVQNKGCGPYILKLPSGSYTIRLDVDDFQGNSASSTQVISVSTPGTTVIPCGGYPTIAAAIASLNSFGVPPGGITFNVDANYIETGVNLVLNTTTSSASNPIVFQKNPYQPGANPKLIVAAGGPATTDGGIIIAGTDYVTFKEIDIDASAQTTIEWGYALVKRQNVPPFDGCQNTTISGCNITLNRANTVETSGIYSGNHIATNTTALAITSTSDACNYTNISGNSISNIHNGIKFVGYNVTGTTPNYALYDHYNEIGTLGQNVISNYGSTTIECYGVYGAYQDSIKIMNNSITSGSGTLKRMAGVTLTSGTGSSAEIAYNTISVSSSATGSVNLYGIWNNLGTPPSLNCVTIHHNVISNCSYITATTGPMYGIFNSARPDTVKIYDNEIYNSTYSGTSSNCFGIQSNASGTIQYINNNHLHHFTNTNAGPVTMISIGQFGVSNICNNIIHDIFSNGGTVTGINSSSSPVWNVYQNNIYNLSSGGTTGLVNGITNGTITGGAATANIYNNFVSGLSAPASTNSSALNGIYVLRTGTTNNVMYNTVYLDQAVAGSASFGSSAFSAETGATTTLINNVFVNVSASGATGFTMAHRRTTANLATYSATSNNNDFYAGIPGPNNLIFYDGTTPVPTLPAYQALVAPRDAAAFSENPPFKNILLSPYNLHLKTGMTTLCESGGTLATAPLVIPEDLDGEPRFPNPGYPDNPFQPATAPDVGADEFAGGLLPKHLHLYVLLEGLYDGLGTMHTAQDELGPHWPPHVADHVIIELHNALDYTIIEHEIPDVELTITGDINIPVDPVFIGSYYITIKHRNSIETTTSIPVDFSVSDAIDYRFDTELRAYGNNMKVFPDGQVAIWTGDPNHDGLVDGSDMNDIGNLNDIFATGYLDEDINGDGLVDGTDLNMTGNNNDLFVRSMTP